ncbi:hypothetical protein [Nostoc sp.]|uniref:hypothetical protein n=1 Tax=Nostoc sp. TaxID=1180 RepID=UPI002FFB603D
MRKQTGILRKQYAFLLAESTEMRKQTGILRKQYAFLLTKSTEMKKQYVFLLIELDLIKCASEQW